MEANGGGTSRLLSIKEETFSLGSHCFGHLCLQLPPLFKASGALSGDIKCSSLVRLSVKKHHSPHHGKRGDQGVLQWRGQKRRWSSLYIIITSFQGSSLLLNSTADHRENEIERKGEEEIGRKWPVLASESRQGFGQTRHKLQAEDKSG